MVGICKREEFILAIEISDIDLERVVVDVKMEPTYFPFVDTLFGFIYVVTEGVDEVHCSDVIDMRL